MAFALISLRDVRRRIPRSRSTLYGEMARGVFPRSIKAGRSSYWRDDEVDDLIAAYAEDATQDDLRNLCEGFYRRRRGDR
jgi:prophage regulatory protein